MGWRVGGAVLRCVVLPAVLLAGGAAAGAQATPPSAPSSPAPAAPQPAAAKADCGALKGQSRRDCEAAAAAKPARPSSQAAPADPFAFPEEQSKHGADPDGGLPDVPAAPAAGSAADKASGGKAAGARRPDTSDMPTSGVPDPPSSSSSSSSSSGSSSGEPGSPKPDSASAATKDDDSDVPPTTADPNSRVKAAPLRDLGSSGDSSAARAKLEATRLEDDLKVGNFYLRDGNAQGAYLRFKDAVEHDATDPDAQFGLAEAALKLNKRDEAAEHFRACLAADPGGDHAKAAKRALAQLAQR